MAKDDAPDSAAPAAEPVRAHTTGRTLGQAAGSLGRPLREIKGERVVVTALDFDADRKIKALADDPEKGITRGQLVAAEAVIITVEGQDASGSGIRYFSFSPSLASKLRSVDPTELPLPAVFVTRDIGGGQEVWDVE